MEGKNRPKDRKTKQVHFLNFMLSCHNMTVKATTLLSILACLFMQFNLLAQVDSLKQELAKANQELKVDILNKIASELAFPQTDSSQFYAGQALQLAQKISYEKGKAVSHRSIGFASHLRGKFDTALYHYDKSLLIEEKGTDSVAIYSLLNNRGAIYQVRGNFPKALEAYQQSLSIKKALNKTASAATTLNNIGIIHFEQKDYQQALNFYEQALSLDSEIANHRGMARSLGNIGLTYIELEQFAEALEYYKTAYDISDSLALPCQKLYAANGLGEAYFETGNLALAQQYCEEALSEGYECEDPSTISSALLTLGQVNLVRHNMKEGEKLLLESYQTAISNGLQWQAREISFILYQHYKESGDLNNALTYFERYTISKDSVFNENLTKELTSMAMTYAFDQEKDSIQFLQQKTALTHKAELSKRSFSLRLTIIILVAVLIFSFVIYRFYVQKRRANEVLAEKNQVITTALEEREILLREVHHRVKNNFQLVSGVLMIQANSTSNEDAKNALLEVRNRIQSMALTHQRLYQSDSIASVEISPFVEGLIEELKLSHDEFGLVTSIEEIDVPIDSAITLGLILTEGMLNVFKHAFLENENPELSVEIRKADKGIELILTDNGRGFVPEENPTSFGLKMIRSMAQKASGTVNWQNKNGTVMHAVLQLS